MGLYLGLCLRYRGLASLARYRMAFYDTRLHYAVRYARHALAIDENRRKFDCVPWHEDHCKDREAAAARVPARFKQVWFAGSHSDIGGSYPDTESRLSDIALTWMVEEAASLPEPIAIDHSLLQLFPDGAGAQHDERKAFISACPGWLVRGALLFVAARNFGWREGHRRIPEDAHPAPHGAGAVQAACRAGARRYDALPAAPSQKTQGCKRLLPTAARARRPPTNGRSGIQAVTTSSVITLNSASRVCPKLVDRATSVASRPRAIRMRPMRGLLWRASNVYQRPSR